jgi:RimJ/RimL family protein N-acetyltransferase
MGNNPKIAANLRDIFPSPYRAEDGVNFIKRVRQNEPQSVFGICIGGRLCGVIGVYRGQDVERKSAEIGYWIGEEFWGRGIASAAVEQMVQYAFENFDFNRIFGGCFEKNDVSMRVLEKNGFQKEGIFRKGVFKNGEFFDMHIFSKLR